jgi:hypothetical protein
MLKLGNIAAPSFGRCSLVATLSQLKIPQIDAMFGAELLFEEICSMDLPCAPVLSD